VNCRRCGRELATWDADDPAAYRRYNARGLDQRCYGQAAYDGTLIDYPRATWPVELLLEELAVLTGSRGMTLREAAAELGLKKDSVVCAIRRHRKRQEKVSA